MNHVKKLVLVPVEEWEKVEKQSSRKIKVETVEVPVGAAEKMSKSGQKLEKKTPMTLLQIRNPKAKGHPAMKRDVTWIIEKLPKKYQSKGFSLLRYVIRSPHMGWSDDGTFKYKGKLITDSYILHLVLHALLKKVKAKPPGMKKFYLGLKDINVPDYLVANLMGKQILSGEDDDSNKPLKRNK